MAPLPTAFAPRPTLAVVHAEDAGASLAGRLQFEVAALYRNFSRSGAEDIAESLASEILRAGGGADQISSVEFRLSTVATRFGSGGVNVGGFLDIAVEVIIRPAQDDGEPRVAVFSLAGERLQVVQSAPSANGLYTSELDVGGTALLRPAADEAGDILRGLRWTQELLKTFRQAPDNSDLARSLHQLLRQWNQGADLSV